MKLKFGLKELLGLVVFILIGLVVFCFWQNNSIVVNNIIFENAKVSDEFQGYKIVHISDLHNKEFGENHSRLVKKIKNANPDIIVITGDLIDSYNTKVDIALEFIDEAVKIAPVYYVSGNHEIRTGLYEELKLQLEHRGVTVLHDEKVEIIKGDSTIDLIGITDVSYAKVKDKKQYVETTLDSLIEENNNLKILLSHRPELFNVYAESKVDLVFSGHAHGGQIRLPLVGGLFAPGQGLLPEYTEGVHSKNNISMIISRGLGNSIFPLRIFNRPEVVVVTLSK